MTDASGNHNHNRIINNNSSTQACAACKYQRRKCAPDCILAPYFPHDRQRQFLNAHKLFGVSNISKIIRHLTPPEKDIAMRTIIYQSDVRAKDPVGGCYRIIRYLQHQIEIHKAELDLVLQQLAICQAQESTRDHKNQNDHNNNNAAASYGMFQIYDHNGIVIQNENQLTDQGNNNLTIHHQDQQLHSNNWGSIQDQESLWLPSEDNNNIGSCREHPSFDSDINGDQDVVEFKGPSRGNQIDTAVSSDDDGIAFNNHHQTDADQTTVCNTVKRFKLDIQGDTSDRHNLMKARNSILEGSDGSYEPVQAQEHDLRKQILEIICSPSQAR